MKSITRNLLVATAAVIALTGVAPECQAAKVTLDGSGYYELGPTIKYYRKGAKQTGRYENFGTDYYHRTVIGMRWITNHSYNRTGRLSFEFWAMPYYGATKGIVLMTRGLSPLGARDFYGNKRADGDALFLNDYRFPELNLWENTRNGWRWRDALSFKHDNLL